MNAVYATLQPLWQAFQDNPASWLVTLTLVSACVGSFINVVVWRLPLMLEQQWNQAAAEQLNATAPNEPQQPISLSKPASHCPKCKKSIRWYHNVPVAGWLVLGGKCHDCKAPISIRYPSVELITALFGLAVAWHFGATATALAAMVFVWVLIAISLIDQDTQLIPDVLVLPLLWLGLLLNLNGLFAPLEQAVIGAATGYLILWSLFHAFRLLTGKHGMGYGDFKLLAAFGAWFGWIALPLILLVASFAGAFWGIGQRLTGHLKPAQAMPFGPWLALGGVVYLFFGNLLNRWWLGI